MKPKQSHKICAQCKKDLPANKFYTRKKSGRLLSECKNCAKKRGRKNCRRYNLARLNFTLTQYEALVEEQNGLCAICGQPEKVFNQYSLRNLCVDHNHKTGKVRALLCSHCNHLIGNAKEDIEVLASAIKYLNKWNK